MVVISNDHLINGAPQEFIFKHDDHMIADEKDTKLCILEHLDNIKLSKSQYIATSINCGLYIDIMFVHGNFTYNFCRQLNNVINSNPQQNHAKI